MGKKPGWKTTEFWMNLILSLGALVVGTVLASGGVAEGSQGYGVLIAVAGVLKGLGYDYARGKTKSSELNAAAVASGLAAGANSAELEK